LVYMGSTLRGFRAKQKISSEEMADKVCISQSTYSKYENNKLPVPLQVIIQFTKANNAMELFTEWYNGILKEGMSQLMA
jgi:transcriptional regulator with XRE-family HTH domain